MSERLNAAKRRKMGWDILFKHKSGRLGIIPKRKKVQIIPERKPMDWRTLFGIKAKKGFAVKKGKIVQVSKRRKRVKDAAKFTPRKTRTYKKRLIVQIELSELARTYSVMFPELMDDIEKTLQLIYLKVYNFIARKKVELIPRNTGALRRSLLRSLTVNRQYIRKNGILIIEIGSGLPYLEYVEKMPTLGKPHVQHPPYIARAGGYTDDPSKASYVPEKDDPKALYDFMKFIKMSGVERAKKAFWEAIRETKLYTKYKGIFGWTAGSHPRQLFIAKYS